MNFLDFFRNLPNPLKFILIFIIGLIVVAGLFHPSELVSIFNQPKADELIEVQILIQSEENQPLQDVEVQFTTQGPPESKYTNSSGYAQIKIPNRNQVDITLSKKGYQTKKETINMKTDPDRNKTFRLQRDSSSLNKQSIDYFYTPKINEAKIIMNDDLCENKLIKKQSLFKRQRELKQLKGIETMSIDAKTISDLLDSKSSLTQELITSLEKQNSDSLGKPGLDMWTGTIDNDDKLTDVYAVFRWKCSYKNKKDNTVFVEGLNLDDYCKENFQDKQKATHHNISDKDSLYCVNPHAHAS